MAFNINTVRADFPILNRKIHDKPLIYLDNAATTQKPQVVIDRITSYYKGENSNIHRGVHFLSQEATTAFEEARVNIADFIHAPETEGLIFTKGTTESVNMVAESFGRKVLNKGDEVLITEMEHHSNLVPWQMLCYERKAKLRVVPFNDKGELDIGEFETMLGPRTKIAAFTHVSNALGTINPVKELTRIAHDKGVPVLIDGAQALAHVKVDLSEIDCDFYAFSGHKAYGPMGVGVLYGKQEHLKFMNPYQSGGEMVDRVSLYETSFNELPFKFEAGTPNVEAVLGMNAAIEYVKHIGMDDIIRYEDDLMLYATQKLKEIDGLIFYGQARDKTAVLSFNIGDIHPYDAGTIIDKYGVAVRTGHHCAQPLMERYGITGTIRASLSLYNTKEEIDVLVEAIHQVKRMFS